MRPLVLGLSIVSLACSPRTPPATEAAASESSTTPSAAPVDLSLLESHRWMLEASVDEDGKRTSPVYADPNIEIGLSFADGRLHISGGCNSISAPYTLSADGELSVRPGAATLKACAPELMKADREVNLMMSLDKPYPIRIEAGSPPRLYFYSKTSRDFSIWRGEPTAEARYGAAKATLFLEVAPHRVDCEPGTREKGCLSVREIRYDDNGVKQPPSDDWRPLQGDIEGFEFREGERKVLRIKKYQRPDAPAGASPDVYVLDLIVEAEIAPPMAP